MAEIRLLIDFATGDNWELPVGLYERFQKEQYSFSEDGVTIIQQWIASLTKEERALVTKR